MKPSGKLFLLCALLLGLSLLCSCTVAFVNDPSDPALTTTTVPATVVTETDKNGAVVTAPPETEASGDGTTRETKKNGTSLTSVFEKPSDNKKPSGGISSDRLTTEKETSPKSDKDTISSDKYLIKGRMETGNTLIPYTVAHSGDNYTITAQLSGVTIITISTKTKMYLLSPDKKIYCDADKLKEYMDQELASIDKSSDRKKVSSGTEKVDGMTLKYIKYDDGSIDYYHEETLVKQVSYNEDGEKITLYVDDVSSEVASSNFKIPAGYMLVPTDQFMTLELGSASATTTKGK